MLNSELETSGHDGKVYIFARFRAREGKETALETALREEIPQARDDHGSLAVNAYRSIRDQRLYFVHSLWVDEAAFDAHARTPHTVHFVEVVEKLIDYPLDVIRTHIVGIHR